MSAAEIADNKWERESIKPPVTAVSSIAQMIMMVGFAGFFGYIIVFSLIGTFSEHEAGALEDKYNHMNDAKDE